MTNAPHNDIAAASDFTQAHVEEHMEDFAALFASHEKSSEHLQPGQKARGVIIAIAGENVFVDVGIKVDGIMERKDILDVNGEAASAVGDTIEAWVVSVSAHEIRLSRSMSGSGVAALEEARDAALPVEGRVTSVCKGGYTVDIMGKRAFCPGSQMEGASQEAPDAVLGHTMHFLVTRIESRGRNIVVSRRALLERERKEALQSLLTTLKEGDTIEGRVTRLAAFGAFMEVAPSVEGMIHVSELSWSRVAQADEAVSPGDSIRAKVLSITQDAKGNTRISLSRKQAEGDPWAAAEGRLTTGALMQGRVTRLAPFGAFIEVLPGVEGLAHISELSWTQRVHKPEDMLNVGETVSVKVKEFSVERRRLSLSLRDAEGDPWAEVAQRFPVGCEVTGTVDSRTQHGLFITLMPGVTGLAPATVLKADKTFAALNPGDSVTLTIQSVDVAQRRISLAPLGTAPQEDTSWKQYAAPQKPVQPQSTAPSLGTLGQALQNALKQKA